MEVLLGITGKDFTIIAASKAAMRGATVLKASDDKTRALNDQCILAFSGEAGDTIQFAEYVQANVSLYSTRNGYPLDISQIASFTRSELARSLRSRKPYNVNLLLGGIIPPTSTTHNTPTTASSATPSAPNTSSGTSGPVQTVSQAIPKLYWLDYLASVVEVPYAAHGYAQYYCLSILDKHHHPDIDLETGLKLLRMCSEELRRRLPIDFKGLTVKVVTPEGVKIIEELGEQKIVMAP